MLVELLVDWILEDGTIAKAGTIVDLEEALDGEPIEMDELALGDITVVNVLDEH